jgi:hypothetical protein
MRLKQLIEYPLIAIFMIILFILIPQNIVKAATISPSDFNDGITNWTGPYSTNSTGELPIGSSLKLGYAFGTAQNANGKVTNGTDSDVSKYSESSGVNLRYSKMNIFLDQDGLEYNGKYQYGNYISSTFQGGLSNIGSNPISYYVSTTSPDFMISPPDSKSSNGIKTSAFSVLGGNASGTNNEGMTDKKFYKGTDENGNPAYKIMGNFTRTGNSGYKNGTYNLEIELLLRASPTNSAIVQREMYVKNTSSSNAEFITLFGQDTKLGAIDGGNDNVPIYDMGNKQGLYIEDSYLGHSYRLMITNQMKDGFTHYNGQTTSLNWASGLGGYPDGNGAEQYNYAHGYKLTKNVDTSYVLSWDPVTLTPNQTAHFGSTMGVTAKPYSIPTPTKTYTNETRSTGENKVGDKLKFTPHLVNNGYGAKWNAQQIVDQLPKGLQIDTGSITRSSDGTTISQPDATDYDSENRTLTIPMPFSLTDNQSETVTFEATITDDALQNLDSSEKLTNKADFTGSDYMVSPSQVDKYSASTSFPVSAPDYNASFTKKIKNITNNEDYKSETTAKPGDKIGYDIIYKVASGSKDHLLSATTIDDDLPAGLTLDKKSIYTTGSDGVTYQQTWGLNTGTINELKAGQQVEITFEATVTSSTVGTITNNAYITGVKTSGNQTYDKQLSTDAILHVKRVNGFIKTPTNIDFGTTNMYGKAKILQNVTTDGELIVAHPDSNQFNVNVSYDNDASDSQMKNNDNDTIPTSDTGLLFIRQRNDSYNDVGTWQPILPTGTPIQTTPFEGNQQTVNLTNYVGVNDWQIKLDSSTKVGTYHGTLTWTLNESI